MTEQVQITEELKAELNKQLTIYVNKHYFMQCNALVKISMFEGDNSRVSITMGVQEFMAFLDAAKGHMDYINKMIAAHQENVK